MHTVFSSLFSYQQSIFPHNFTKFCVFKTYAFIYLVPYAQDFVRFKDNLFPAAYSSRFIQLFRYFVAGKLTYTASISSNKWLKVEKKCRKVENNKNLKFAIKYLQKPGVCGNRRWLKMSLGQW